MILCLLHLCLLSIYHYFKGILSFIIIIIYNIIKNYVYIIEDIRDTLNIDLSFELDLNVLSNNLFKGMFNYGR